MKGYGVDAFVRAPWNDFVTVKRILDAGANGVLIPYVCTKQDAEAAVKAVLYPPRGIRGRGGKPQAEGYGVGNGDYFPYADQEIMLMVAIETQQGVDNLDQICRWRALTAFLWGPWTCPPPWDTLATRPIPSARSHCRHRGKDQGCRQVLGHRSGRLRESPRLVRQGISVHRRNGGWSSPVQFGPRHRGPIPKRIWRLRRDLSSAPRGCFLKCPRGARVGRPFSLGVTGLGGFSFWLGGLFGGTNGAEVDANGEK